MRKLSKFFAAALCIGLAVVYVGCADYDDDIKNLQGQIDAMKTGPVASVEEQLKSHEAIISALNTTSSELQSTIVSMQGDIASSNATLAALGSDLSSLQGSMSADVTNLQGLIGELRTQMGSLATTADLNAAIAASSDKLTSLQNTLQSQLSDLQKAVDARPTTEDLTAAREAAIQAAEEAANAAAAAAGKADEAAAKAAEAEAKAIAAQAAAASAGATAEAKAAAAQAAAEAAQAKAEAAEAKAAAAEAANKAMEEALAEATAGYDKVSESAAGALGLANEVNDKLAEISGELAGVKSAAEAAAGAADKAAGAANDAAGKAAEAAQKAIDAANAAAKNASELAEAVASIQALAKRVDDLEIRIAASEVADKALKADIDALKASLANYATKEDLSQLEATLASYATTAYVAEAIAKVEKALGSYATTESMTAAVKAAEEAAVKAAGEAAANAFSGRFNAELNKAIASDGVVSSYVQEAIDTYNETITDLLTTTITEEKGKITKDFQDTVNDAKAALLDLIKGRLTSLTLIPELYINGIEAIELNALTYQSLTNVAAADAKKETNPTRTGSNYTINADKVKTIKYHISPSNVTEDGIGALKFILQTAVTKTRATKADELFTINDYRIGSDDANGIRVLEVDLEKNKGANLNPGNGKIYTVALEATLAESLWVSGAEAKVYSDYVMLSENVVNPRIAKLKWTDHTAITEATHYAETYEAAKTSTTAVVKAAYNEPLDLLSLVTGCDINNKHSEFDKDACAAAGLYWEFNVVQEPWEVGETKTDQQKHAKVNHGEDGTWTLTSMAPGSNGEITQTAIGKKPVVRVVLRDSKNNNAYVDVRYFRVEWTTEDAEDKDFEIVKTFKYTLNCDGFHGTFTWQDMSEQILTQLNEKAGMSKADFIALYNAPANADITTDDPRHTWNETVDCITPVAKRTVGTVATTYADGVEIVYTYASNSTPQDGVFDWYLTTEQIGSIMHEIQTVGVVKRYVTITCTSKTPERGNLTFTFEVEITLPDPAIVRPMPGRSWAQDEADTFVLTPQILGTTDRTGAKIESSHNPDYDLDVQNMFREKTIVEASTNTGCFAWDIQFDRTQNPGNNLSGYSVFTSNTQRFELDPQSTDRHGYDVLKSNLVAAYLDYTMANERWYSYQEDATKHVFLGINNNAPGIALVETSAANSRNKLSVNIWGRHNEYNYYLIKNYKARITRPLEINQNVDGSFDDGFMGEQTIEGIDLTMKDFMGYTVSAKPKNNSTLITGTGYYQWDLLHYYKVESIKFDTKNAVVQVPGAGEISADTYFGVGALTTKASSITRAGTDGTSWTVTVDDIVYKKLKSDVQTTVVTIKVPVTVKHYWGELKETVYIPVNPTVKGVKARR